MTEKGKNLYKEQKAQKENVPDMSVKIYVSVCINEGNRHIFV